MEQALTHKDYGYYMKQDVFNKQGDFVTSPEISQMFGECIGIWIITFLDKMGLISSDNSGNMQTEGFNLVEFGPGRASLMKVILNVLNQFGLLKNISLHFIEVSEFLKKIQMENLQDFLKQYDIYFEYSVSKDPEQKTRCEIFSNTDFNIHLHWYSTFEDYKAEIHDNKLKVNLIKDFIKKPKKNTRLEDKPVIILSNEFFDA